MLPSPPIPDSPRGFGYKIGWFAIRGTSPKEVADAFGLQSVVASNWEQGIQQAYAVKKSVFVTPSLTGWILVVGSHFTGLAESDPGELTIQLETLSLRFGEAQYFMTHRVVEAHSWARARAGVLLRGFEYSSGATRWDCGSPSAEESAFGFHFFDENCAESKADDYWDREDLEFPSEEHVMKLAKAWSLDPTELESEFLEKSMGLRGSL